MKYNATQKLLVVAREVQAEGWCQHQYTDEHGNRCMSQSINVAKTRVNVQHLTEIKARRAIMRVAAEKFHHEKLGITAINDGYVHNVEEALALFDEAITAAG